MAQLTQLARRLGTSQRTLRRAADLGLLRATRVSERRVDVPDAEQRYLRARWPLLSGLRGALRTEPNVRLAVLFGSTARGDDHATSDVDILVDLRDPSRSGMFDLQARLGDAVTRDIDLVRLHDAQQQSWLLAEILQDGRVLIDRDGAWPALSADADRVALAGERDLDDLATAALRRVRTRAR